MTKTLLLIAVLLLAGCAPATKKVMPTPTRVLALPTIVHKTVCVSVGTLTVRSGPGVSFYPVLWVVQGTVLAVVEDGGKWIGIEFANTSGYVNSRYTEPCHGN